MPQLLPPALPLPSLHNSHPPLPLPSSLPLQRTHRHPHQRPRPRFKAAWISALEASAAVVVVAVVAAAAVAAAAVAVAAVAGGTPAQFRSVYNPFPRLQGPFLSTRRAS